MSDVLSLSVENGIGVIAVNSPPVNALGAAVRQGLHQGFSEFAADDAVRAIVLICEGRTFFAGADITEFGRPPAEPGLRDLLGLIESSRKPVVAAIHGAALGGGLETALVCHYRIAARSAQIGLPEVNLGLLPGAGGTQRLPRLVGVEAALDLMLAGRAIGAAEALKLGVIDAISEEGRLREDAVDLARKLVTEGYPLLRVRDRNDKIEAARGRPEIFAEVRRHHARAFRGFKAPENIIKAVEAAVDLSFDEGMQQEYTLFCELEPSIESQAQRYAFFAERETARIPDVPSSTPTLPVKSVGVIGAGTMGAGIAMNFLNVGLPVVVVETSQQALDRGVANIRKNYEGSARKGRLTPEQVEGRMSLITPTLSLEALAGADLVIEAVFEEMGIKKEIFGKLDAIAKPGAILASNTSFLDLNEIASSTARPASVVGLHFFSPANVMKLLEVVRGSATSKEVLATAMRLAKTIGKVPVVSRVCHGFIANRLMNQRMVQADALVLEGPTPADIDRVMYDYGFAMGAFQMLDLVGLDVIGRGESERSVRGDLVRMGRLGQKQGGGYYDYDDQRRSAPSAAAEGVIADFARFKGIANAGAQSDEEILCRLLYPVVNEGAKLLEEGIALRASDIDMAAILGYNWPIYTGGPMFWADTIGLKAIVEKLLQYQSTYGDAFRPAGLLVRKAAQGESFTHDR